jgi:hypothetical protein
MLGPRSQLLFFLAFCVGLHLLHAIFSLSFVLINHLSYSHILLPPNTRVPSILASCLSESLLKFFFFPTRVILCLSWGIGGEVCYLCYLVLCAVLCCAALRPP